MQKGNFYKKSEGFSLVEMMVVLTIIIIVSASLVPLMVFVNQGSHNNQNKMTANNLAASIMEEIRAMEYEDIGTEGGNPSGSIPQFQSANYNGVEYEVETLISWGAAKGKDEEMNPVAYKNARIIVRGQNTFTKNTDKLAELHTVITREGEEPLIKDGHLRARVLNSTREPIVKPSVMIQISGPLNQQQMTDYSGTALFGILDAGDYNVRARVEEGLIPSPKETAVDGWIERNNVAVMDYAISDVEFNMEKIDNVCKLEIKLIDGRTGKTIVSAGKATLTVTLDGVTYPVYSDKEFVPEDFIDDCLPAEFSGDLWPGGTYNIIITDVSSYHKYNLSIDGDAFVTGTGERWTGVFSEKGTTLSVTIPMKFIYFYEEKTKKDYENNTEMEDLVATDNDTLELDNSSVIIDNKIISKKTSSKSKNNSGPDMLFDGQIGNNSAWYTNKSPTDNDPQWFRCEFESNVPITGIKVYLMHKDDNNNVSNPNHKPKDFFIRVSNDGISWETVYSGTFPLSYSYTVTFNRTVTCKYLELRVTSEYGNKNQGIRMYEVEILAASGKSDRGERLSKPIPLSDHDSTKKLYIEWDAIVPEGTTFEVYTAVIDGTREPTAGDFKKVNYGDFIPDIGYGQNLEDTYLWIRENFTTTNNAVTPVLNWLRVIKDED